MARTDTLRLASHFSAGDFPMRRSLILAAIATGMLAGSFADAQPITRLQVGILECRGGASVGFIVGSVTNLGITQESALAWNVWAPVAQLGAGALSGNYAGAQGSASVGVGVGGNALVGGSDNSIALQPLS